MNTKKSSSGMASEAAKILSSKTSSNIQQVLAGSVLSQADPQNQTSGKVETIAAKALMSPKYSETTKSLAGSVLSQSSKKR